MARGYVVEKNGRWYIQIFDDTGRSTMRSVAKELGKKDATEKDAQKLLWRKLAEADNDGIAYSAKITLDKYLHDCPTQEVKTSKKKASLMSSIRRQWRKRRSFSADFRRRNSSRL
jgi:hypothetical protein